MRARLLFSLLTGLALAGSALVAQESRPMSPHGTAATQVLGKWVQEKPDAPRRYVDGKWIEVTYGRPIRRGRDLFGSGSTYGHALNDSAPVWRAGANQTTRFRTEVPLQFAGKTLPAGEYSLFVDLKETEWTLILSNHTVQKTFDPNEKVALFGSMGYDPKLDVLRAPMKLERTSVSVDQFTMGFVDMTATGGKLAMWWDKEMATVPFTVVQ